MKRTIDKRQEIAQTALIFKGEDKVLVNVMCKRHEQGLKSSYRVTSGYFNGRLLTADEILRIVSKEDIENVIYSEF